MSADEMDLPEEVVWEGKYIAAKRRGRWEYVSRTGGVGAAVILAVDGAQVLLVEQFRVPIRQRCLELPAGLVGDHDKGEDPRTSAMRELEEETGYRAREMVDLGRFYASSGMSSEGFTLMRAHGLEKVGHGGGVEGEDIQVHLVPLSEIADFVAAKRAAGVAIDVKLLLLLGPHLLG